jgi:hypothetical protein
VCVICMSCVRVCACERERESVCVCMCVSVCICVSVSCVSRRLWWLKVEFFFLFEVHEKFPYRISQSRSFLSEAAEENSESVL